MALIDPGSARDFLEAIVAASSLLGGAMAYESGFRATQAIAYGLSPDQVAHQINEGIAWGFVWGTPIGVGALIIMVWT